MAGLLFRDVLMQALTFIVTGHPTKLVLVTQLVTFGLVLTTYTSLQDREEEPYFVLTSNTKIVQTVNTTLPIVHLKLVMNLQNTNCSLMDTPVRIRFW